MKQHRLTPLQIADFRRYLRREERAPATIEKYIQNIQEFSAFLQEEAVSKEAAARWKESLLTAGLAPATVNGKLSALNSLLRFLGREDCRVRFLRLQRQIGRAHV